MSNLIYLPEDKEKLKTIFNKGELFAYPTETVFGLGCDYKNEEALKKLINLKQRKANKGFIIIADSWERLAEIILPIPESEKNAMDKINKTYPTTFLLKAQNNLSNLIKINNKVAVRIVKLELIQIICEVLNSPLISSSANLSQQSPARTVLEVQLHFPNLPIIAGKIKAINKASKILDWETKNYLR